VNIKALAAFAEVAAQGHFGRAAQNLGMTQSGLSQLVKKLEGTIGAKLIERTTRRVSLTDLGEMFLENAQELLQAHRLAEARIANILHGEEGTVRLGFVASAALGIVPKLAALVHDRAPGLRLSLGELTSEEQIPRLKSGEIDVGVLREIRESSGLLIKSLGREPLLAAVPLTHQLSSQRKLHLRELAQEGFIMFPRTKVSFLHDHIYRICNEAGFTPLVVEEAVQFATILGLVSSNAGIAIVPESITAIRLPNVAFLPLADEAAVSEIFLARRLDERASPAAKKLVSLAMNELRVGV
jgi:DNA-binding transcriptional LysR family regulator